MKNNRIPPFPPNPLFDFPSAMYAMDYSTPDVVDVDYVDITDIEDENPGEEAYCVPI